MKFSKRLKVELHNSPSIGRKDWALLFLIQTPVISKNSQDGSKMIKYFVKWHLLLV